MIKIDFKNIYNANNYLTHFSEIYNTPIKDDYLLEIDNEMAKGTCMNIKSENFQMLLIDIIIHQDSITKFIPHHEYDYTSMFFVDNITYKQPKVDLTFKSSYGFVLFKESDKAIFNSKKNDHIQRVVFYFDKICFSEKVNEKLNQFKNFILHTGDANMGLWKKSIYNYDQIAPALRENWLFVKSIELFTLMENVLMNIEEQQEKKIYTDYELESVYSIKDEIDANLKVKPITTELSKKFGINMTKLEKIFKYLFDKTVYQYFKDKRIHKVHDEVKETDKPFTEIAYEYGFTDLHHMSKSFKTHFGITLSEFRDLNHD